MPHEDGTQRGGPGFVQRVSASVDPHGSMVADVLAQLRADPDHAGSHRFLTTGECR